MPYRADFYIAGNIIGYTGPIDLHPTVYFKTGPDNGPNQYGHITQFHEIRANLGREEVHRSGRYEMKADDDGNLQESDNGKVFHTSRSKFISSAGLAPDRMELLMRAITRFEEKKTWGDLDKAQRDQYFKGMDDAEMRMARLNLG